MRDESIIMLIVFSQIFNVRMFKIQWTNLNERFNSKQQYTILSVVILTKLKRSEVVDRDGFTDKFESTKVT